MGFVVEVGVEHHARSFNKRLVYTSPDQKTMDKDMLDARCQAREEGGLQASSSGVLDTLCSSGDDAKTAATPCSTRGMTIGGFCQQD